MAWARESELFERFRRTHEPAALAAVFDAVAPDLLRIALHTCGRIADAEDVVPATFVAAIEGAGRWDGRRGLFPWLVGILVRQTGLLRRSRARTPDPERIAPRPADDPQAAAIGAELDDAVADALAQLGELHRPVVHLHLRHGLDAKEIAAALGRPHARVRQQLVRGLRQLRALLPSGLAVVAALAIGSGRGLAAVRAAVLRRAAEVLPLGAGAAAGATVAGVLAMKKVLMAAAALCLFAFVCWSLGAPPTAPATVPPHAL